MTKIIPAILPKSYRAITDGVETVFESADTIQIDFVDGTFAPNRTWMFNNKDEETLASILREDEGLPHWSDINYELDVMVKEPLAYIDTFMALGPAKVIFHIGSFEQNEMLDYLTTLPDIIQQTVEFGMAISLDQDVEEIIPYSDFISTIQCMGIANVGNQGQEFDERVYEQVRKAKLLFPAMLISVDGGVTLDNAEMLVEAGASALVVGSGIFQNNNPRGTLEEFKSLCRN